MRNSPLRIFARARPPEIADTFSRPQGFSWEPEAPLSAEFRARSGVRADNNRPTITIFDYIGDEGFSDARMAAALRSVGAETSVLVEMNSPGGDYFQGVAIFNMLRRHKGEVLVQILGQAASAGSLIAMAGDKIEIAKNGEVMLHKAWGITIGNEEDHVRTIGTLKHLDDAMAATYAERTGRERVEILAMMAKDGGKGTMLRGEKAVEMGFADAVMDVQAQPVAFADAADQLPASLRQWDRRLAGGERLTKAERRALFNDIRGMQDAAARATQDAGETVADLLRLAQSIHP